MAIIDGLRDFVQAEIARSVEQPEPFLTVRAVVTQASPLMVQLIGASTPVTIAHGNPDVTYTAGDEVALIKLGTKWWVAGRINGAPSLPPSVLSDSIYNETPGGLINGTNTVFSTAYAYITGTLRVFVNGLRQEMTTDFTETTGTTFTFVLAPTTSSRLIIDYTRA